MDFTKLQVQEDGQQYLKKRGPIEEGDLVIISERHDSFQPLYVKKGVSFQNRFGEFHHDDIIGKNFGSKVRRTLIPDDGGILLMLMMMEDDDGV